MGTDKFVPDRDERVTQIIVIELLQKHSMQAQGIAEAVNAYLQKELGYILDVDYMVSVGQPDDLLSNPSMTDFMSSKQEGYLRKLLGDLRPLVGRYKVGLDRGDKLDPEVYRQAETTMTVVFSEMDAHILNKKAGGNGTIGPRRGSELIDATKNVIEDLQGELNGV